MLGAVFDSCALSGQDRHHYDLDPESGSRSRFTKLTVMLGGPYGASSPDPSSPASELVPTLLDALRRHLGYRDSEGFPEPCLVRVRQHWECIPTPTVGHVQRMAELGKAVRERMGPNAYVIGAGVGGVSVGDCVESGRRVALEV